MELIEPRTLRDALRELRRDPELVPIAGCTDVFVELGAGTRKTRRYLNLWNLDELRGIRARKNVLTIGGTTTFTEIHRSKVVNAWAPMLAAAAREIGGVQIQNRGTLGGNVANASPAGDSLPVLLAANARIVLASEAGERTVGAREFFVGYRSTARRSDEVILAIELPVIEGKQWFRKVGTRAAQAISKVVMAGVRGEDITLAIGSVAPVPLRLAITEATLAATGDLESARRAIESEIAPINDIRSTARYRRLVAGNLLAQFWLDTGKSSKSARRTKRRKRS